MKFAVIAAAALVASVHAQDVTVAPIVACLTPTIKPWIAGTDASACFTEAAYKPLLYVVPTDAILEKFCPNARCRALLTPTLAVRPAAGDCTVKAGAIKMYADIVDVFNTKCKDVVIVPSPTTPAPTTVTPAPTTATPEPTTVTPEPTTVTPAPPTTPVVTTKTPCPLPQPTTETPRPSC